MPLESVSQEGEVDPRIIREAREDGWRPKEEFNGREEDWIDAETFVRRGKEINPLLRKNNEKLKRELDAMRAELTRSNSSIEKLTKYHEKMEERAYQRALRELQGQRNAALAANEPDVATQLDEEIDTLKEEREKSKPAPAATETPPKGAVDEQAKIDFTEWAADNSAWYNNRHPEMINYAEFAAKEIRREHPGYGGRRFLDAVSEKVKEQYPDFFGKAAAKEDKGGASMFESGKGGAGGSGGSGGSGRKGNRYSDLTASEKAICDEQCAEEWYVEQAKRLGKKPQEMYLDDYFGV